MACLALYLRLSQDDDDLTSNEQKSESESINSQRYMIQNYIDGDPELALYSVQEFVDDGYSGTNFDRPGFQRMIKQVRAGEIQCIIVKDLSRFGRNYLEVGDYLEHIFPFLKVRFIAINDHYDSNTYLGTTGGIEIAFRNLIYARYSQDLSEKVKAGQHMKMSKGRYVTNCPYGYMKKPGIKHQMFIDPITAQIVREIFLSAIAGKSTSEIAAALNARKVLTPMEYKGLSRKGMHNDAMWSHAAVLRIIQDYKYTGAMVNFKCETMTLRATSQRRRKRDEWVIVENSHEAIVTHEEYDAANASLRKVNYRGFTPRPKEDRIYFCGHCGRHLRKTFGSDEYYSCLTKMYRTDSPCEAVYWSRTDIEEVVLAAYKAQLGLMDKEHQEQQKGRPEDPVQACRKQQRDCEEQIRSGKGQNLHLYEEYKSGQLDRDGFIRAKEDLSTRLEQLNHMLDQLRVQEVELIANQEIETQRAEELALASRKLTASDEELRKRMYADIDKVIVYNRQDIEIIWKFAI